MRVLEGLQPASVLYYFEDICGIPHISYHEKALSDYCVNFAKEHNLFYQQDEMGNVLIAADPTPGYEEEAPIILQGHLDMVGDKVPECPIDMEKESIKIKVDGDYICAEGTTLGGDDGIAVAYALAALAAEDLPHPRLEVVLTVSEEVGLLGAAGMDLSACQGRRLINVDSEAEGILTVSCAGGIRAECRIPVARRKMEGVLCKVTTNGLKGGHSGVEIDKGRANANVLIGRFLLLLNQQTKFGLVSMKGGVKDNVIPKDGQAEFLTEKENLDTVKKTLALLGEQLEAEYGTADPDAALVLTEGENCEKEVLDADSLERVIAALNLMPNGVQAMSMDIPGLVETSLNMGTSDLSSDELKLGFSIRSSVGSAKDQMVRKVELMTKVLGGTTQTAGAYPAWPYMRNSKLRELCVSIFKEQYGYEPKVEAIHAGLECGILSGKLPGLDCVSIGPDMKDIHSPKERLCISSVARVWEYLKALLSAKEK